VPLDPQAQIVIDGIAAVGLDVFNDDTDPNAIRALMNAVVIPSTVELASVEDRQIPGPAGGLPVRIYRPAETRRRDRRGGRVRRLSNGTGGPVPCGGR